MQLDHPHLASSQSFFPSRRTSLLVVFLFTAPFNISMVAPESLSPSLIFKQVSAVTGLGHEPPMPLAIIMVAPAGCIDCRRLLCRGGGGVHAHLGTGPWACHSPPSPADSWAGHHHHHLPWAFPPGAAPGAPGAMPPETCGCTSTS